MLFAAPGPETDQSCLSQVAQNMNAALTSSCDFALLQNLVHLGAGKLRGTPQSSRDKFPAARKNGLTEFQLPVTTAAPGNHSWSQQGENPSDIPRRDKVQGTAHRPGANDRFRGNRQFDIRFGSVGQAQSDGPEGTEIVLCLHGAEPMHDVGRPFKWSASKTLVTQPFVSDVQTCALVRRIHSLKRASARLFADIVRHCCARKPV
jgi:hypothetical protein